MTPEKEKELYNKYPGLFRQKDLDMKQTCMCWGICCGDGWFDLIDQACERWEILKKFFPGVAVELVQVKEKFGSLRLYHEVYIPETYTDSEIEFIDRISSFIEAVAEKESLVSCEECGEFAKINNEGWMTVRCNKHSKNA